MNNNDLASQPFISLSEKNSFIILLNQNPPNAEVCAAIALKKILEKNGKSASLLCSTKINYPNITGLDNISDTFVSSGNNLVVSFPYSEGAIDKVSYQIENDMFNLLITPQPGAVKLDSSKVKFNYSGSEFDSIITINMFDKQKLGNIYFQNISKFEGREMINIKPNQGSLLYETIFDLIKKFNFEIDKDISIYLYNGILFETSSFSKSNISADVFEMCAFLMRNGASKFVDKNAMNNSVNGVPKMKNIEAREVGQNEDEKDWLKPNIFRSGKLV